MNHSIHNLAATPINAALNNQTLSASKKNQPLPIQLHHHTLQHQQQQQHSPLINQHQHQQMLHFHQTLHHPYSTLHHPQHQHQHQHQLNQHQNQLSQSMHFASNSSSTTNTQPASQQGSNGNQQQYNMNSSDYSSSTYHIYDQISDLIIIKQQRMERKRQQEHRRKVILLSLAAILLVGTLMFLIVQSLFSNNSPPPPSTMNQENNNNRNLESPQFDQAGRWLGAPPTGAQIDPSYTSRFGQQPIPWPRLTMPAHPSPSNQLCNNRGVLIESPASGPLCKCDQGYYGDRCELASPTISSQLLTKCLQTNCNGNGQCNLQGKCQCLNGYYGQQCEHKTIVSFDSSTTPTVQTTNRPQVSIKCPSNCAGNGQCMSYGKCKCYPGYSGESCQDKDLCYNVDCLNQGSCDPTTGLCQCKFGFKGSSCELKDDELWAKLFNCSNHGKFNYLERKCNCDAGYSGLDCSEEKCELGPNQQALDCGLNGLFDCRLNKCVCQDGFSGELCQIQQCSAQCLRNPNNQCSVDGQCICQPGFYGKHCLLDGCPNQCSQRGQCIKLDSNSSNQQPEWRCQCQPGSTGDDCGQLVERQCDDGLDNDRDGLVDCADSECCSDKACQNSTLCLKSPDPLDILMRKQPPPPISSFFQRMQFLIEKMSSQIYSHPKDFNDSLLASKYVDRASVIRGRVTYLKQGITGVRVSVAGQTNLGMTLTRDGGYFDLMVNGGGAVNIEFRREPFAIYSKTVRVPWNEIVLIDPIELSLEGSQDISNYQSPFADLDSPSCSSHNYLLMKPVIVQAPKSSKKSSTSTRLNKPAQQQSRAVILKESGMVQQSISLPGSSNYDSNNSGTNESVSLIYISSRANEFMSTINLQILPENSFVPQDLKLVHLKIIIEGNLFEQLLEPQANLSFTYAWNRRNVYKQKSFGLSTASVSIGYEYFDCKHVIWTTKHVQLAGHDLSISDIGNQWNLNIHHRYNYRDSILQRGDGLNFNLKTDRPKIIQPIMGDGYQRQAICPYCDGATGLSEQRLLKPQALVSAPDGSLYVGDFNLIRKIEFSPSGLAGAASSSASTPSGSQPSTPGKQSPDRIVRTILEMPTTRVPSKYSLALNLADQNKLYMSDVDRFQIYLLKEQGKQYQSVDSQQQQQQDGSQSNDTMQVTLSQSPSDHDNLVSVVGNGLKCQLEDRANCGDGQLAKQARLIEPKAIVFDLQSRMYIADGPNVRMVDAEQRIHTLLGDYGISKHTKFPCSGEAIPMHKFIPKALVDLAISPIDETLHILDDNVIYKITQDKRVQIVAGKLAHCQSIGDNDKPSTASNSQKVKATEVYLQSAQSISFNQNGDLFIIEDDQRQTLSRVLLVSPQEDMISLYAGQLMDSSASPRTSSLPTIDSYMQQQPSNSNTNSNNNNDQDKQRSSNILPTIQATRALDYKFNSLSAMVVDQQGKLIVADKMQLKLLSIEPDLPQINAAGEYELQSPDNGDELLIFNRYGHHIATKDLSSGFAQSRSSSGNNNKYSFTYNVNTSFGQLATVQYSNGNKISIYRDGPHHSVKMIETAFGGQCKLDISKNGQVYSILTIAPNTSKTNFSYHVDGGLLKQSRDQASGELFDFSYDEFGRAIGIQHSSPKLASSPIECRLSASKMTPFNSQCSALIVAE